MIRLNEIIKCADIFNISADRFGEPSLFTNVQELLSKAVELNPYALWTVLSEEREKAFKDLFGFLPNSEEANKLYYLLNEASNSELCNQRFNFKTIIPEKIHTQISDPAFFVFVEFTNLCNMDCPFCVSSVLKRRRESLPRGTVLQFLDDLYALGYRGLPIGLHSLGEPFLDKNIYDYIHKCADLGYCASLVTNGLLLQEFPAKSLFEAGLRSVQISFHTPDEEYYLKRNPRPRLTYAKWLAGILQFMSEWYDFGGEAVMYISDYSIYDDSFDKKLIKYDKWYINDDDFREKCQIILTELSKLREEKISANSNDYNLRMKSYCEYRSADLEKGNLTLNPNDFFAAGSFAVLPHITLALKKFGMWTKQPHRLNAFLEHSEKTRICIADDPQSKCSIPRNFVLLSNRNISGCCSDGEGELNFGNIDKNSLKDIIASPLLHKFYDDKSHFSMCRRCMGKIKIEKICE